MRGVKLDRHSRSEANPSGTFSYTPGGPTEPSKLDFVCVDSGNPGYAIRADATAPSAKATIGIVISKNSSSRTVKVQFSGEVEGFTGLVANTDYFLDNAGGHSSSAPTGNGDYVQVVGTAKTANIMIVRIGPYLEL